MKTNDAKDLLSMLTERSAAWNTYWTILCTVAAAFVTAIASGGFLPCRYWLPSTLTSLGFLIFAAGNYHALMAVHAQRIEVVALVKKLSAGDQHIERIADASAPPPSINAFRAYHWCLCLFIVALLFALPALRK